MIEKSIPSHNDNHYFKAGLSAYWSNLAVIAADDLIECGYGGVDFNDSQLFVRSYVVSCWEKLEFLNLKFKRVVSGKFESRKKTPFCQ